MSHSLNKTKIVATVGPASNTKEKLLELVHAGVSIFRLNFSHGDHASHQEVINHIREINATFGHNIGILQDLQGPKIRIGEVENGAVEIKGGEELIITNKPMVGNSQKVSTTYTNITKDVKKGDFILIDDGNLSVKVKEVTAEEIKTEVIFGGMLKSKKGMNLPDTDISAASLTAKDKADLEFGLTQDFNWIALSFVRSAADIEYIKGIIKERGSRARVIAKIERPEAVKNIDDIITASDAIMVARGDLGVEVEMADVPMIQKDIVKKCNKKAKPVIIATQMMESMITNPRPTRAEVNDVANAVMDGADAVMLSAESAAGKYPVQTIQHMQNIIRSVENKSDEVYNKSYEFNPQADTFMGNHLTQHASKLVEEIKAKAIIGMTTSGWTAFRISRHRPKAPIYIFTDDAHLRNTLNLVWGVQAYPSNIKETLRDTLEKHVQFLTDKGDLTENDIYINIAAFPHGEGHKTNLLKIGQVGVTPF
ncbi:pyruvate kinase [Sediminitomix flava]|uniref:Pyruvate kinase n=1 Tax=Sediminitomix flava TaxID=379075 RepID=A0A315ZAF7_SEDFL|nr:pyruvate kinase [Sediminitomix flava]PWJ42043.1 pyruvate kinase [Sediminitomix flava]